MVHLTYTLEYKLWKKNTPFLYDFTITSALEWPTLTLQWFPSSLSTTPSSMFNGPNYTTYQLLTGTYTGQRSTEYINFVGVDIPTKPLLTTEDPYQQVTRSPKVRVLSQIPHRSFIENQFNEKSSVGEVNIARYNPFDPSSIATITNSGDVFLYKTSLPDLTSTNFVPSESNTSTRVLKYHKKAGNAMNWNSKISGLLATGSEDSTVAIWDVNTAVETPKYTLNSTHSATITSVEWSPHIPTALASVSEDGSLVISDTRSSDFSTPVVRVENAHHYVYDANSANNENDLEKSNTSGGVKKTDESIAQKNTAALALNGGAQDNLESAGFSAIYDVSFNPFNQYLLATASADKTTAIWDLRRMDTSVHSLIGHSAGVTSVQWSPHYESVLATGSYDRRVMVWDLSKIGAHDPEENEDGVFELLFVHGGHTSKINALDWHPTLPWVIASAGEDNIIQIWKPAQESVHVPEEDVEEDEEMEDANDNDENANSS